MGCATKKGHRRDITTTAIMYKCMMINIYDGRRYPHQEQSNLTAIPLPLSPSICVYIAHTARVSNQALVCFSHTPRPLPYAKKQKRLYAYAYAQHPKTRCLSFYSIYSTAIIASQNAASTSLGLNPGVRPRQAARDVRPIPWCTVSTSFPFPQMTAHTWGGEGETYHSGTW